MVSADASTHIFSNPGNAFRSSVQLVLPRSIRSLETLWAREVPHGGDVGGVESWDMPCPQIKPQTSRLLNPYENPAPSHDKPKRLRSLLHDLSDQQTADLTPIPISDIPVATPFLHWLSPQGFLTEVKPPPPAFCAIREATVPFSCRFHTNL